HSDILWQNDSGEVAIWELNGTSVIASASVGNPGPSWHAVATGDFNGDGISDILFQNSNGEIAILGYERGKSGRDLRCRQPRTELARHCHRRSRPR
ncbi:MAG TPA: VCBS repeat-containing protein, partial [Stellaceae bacterium]|nr:VCBS repeat-containing protein [Stellaceae bacterium]